VIDISTPFERRMITGALGCRSGGPSPREAGHAAPLHEVAIDSDGTCFAAPRPHVLRVSGQLCLRQRVRAGWGRAGRRDRGAGRGPLSGGMKRARVEVIHGSVTGVVIGDHLALYLRSAKNATSRSWPQLSHRQCTKPCANTPHRKYARNSAST
jgi:hypothetical protein